MRFDFLWIIIISFVKVSCAFTLNSKSNTSVKKMMASNDHGQDGSMIGTVAISILIGIGSCEPAFAQHVTSQTNLLEQYSRNLQIHKVVKSLNQIILTSIGAPSFSGGSSFETLDFSLPSYNEAVGKDSTSVTENKSNGPPSFTATLNEPLVYTPPSPPIPSLSTRDEKGAQTNEVKKLDDEEKKKADLQAKRALEKQKQLEMLERSKRAAEKEREESTTPVTKQDPVPETSKPIRNEVAATASESTKTPAQKKEMAILPTLEIKAPDLLQIQLPSMAIPSFDVPKMNLPVPDFNSFPSIKIPQLETQTSVGNDDKETASVVILLESQEIRDQRAREALVIYKQKDEAAKFIEKQASDARMVANEFKKAAKVAKDEACVTRPGGKLLCVRPWWNLGY